MTGDDVQLTPGLMGPFPLGLRALDGDDAILGSSDGGNDVWQPGVGILSREPMAMMSSWEDGITIALPAMLAMILWREISANDLVEGGDGDDLLRGGRDSDVLLGGNGNDVMYRRLWLGCSNRGGPATIPLY